MISRIQIDPRWSLINLLLAAVKTKILINSVELFLYKANDKVDGWEWSLRDFEREREKRRETHQG